MGRKLILRNHQSPGDVVMLTAAVRDLHRCYPGWYATDVRTACPARWENNPYLTPPRECDLDTESIECAYPLIHRNNQAPYHFTYGYIEHLNEQLGLDVRPFSDVSPFHLRSRPARLNTRQTLDGLTATMSASSIMNVNRR